MRSTAQQASNIAGCVLFNCYMHSVNRMLPKIPK